MLCFPLVIVNHKLIMVLHEWRTCMSSLWGSIQRRNRQIINMKESFSKMVPEITISGLGKLFPNESLILLRSP